MHANAELVDRFYGAFPRWRRDTMGARCALGGSASAPVSFTIVDSEAAAIEHLPGRRGGDVALSRSGIGEDARGSGARPPGRSAGRRA